MLVTLRIALPHIAVASSLVLASACSSSLASAGTDAGTSNDAPPSDMPALPDAGPLPGACDPFGRFPAPTSSFTIHLSDRNSDDNGLYALDVQTRFPSVDWDNIDRLYIEAGTYSYIYLGNLPNRTAEHPLIVTNLGGQVHVGPSPSERFGYQWVMDGGSHWILTGRYDSESQTGDDEFQGHRCGAYANSQDTYGFVSDDEFTGFPEQMSHMGLTIQNATAFEVEFVEIRRCSFAGIRILTPNSEESTPLLPPIEDVSIHDTFIHDTGGEGLYLGSTGTHTQHTKFLRMRVYNNRVIRTANEAGQFQHVGAGSVIEHNVFAWGGLNWRAGFEDNQDNAVQFQLREGPAEFHHNIVVGGMESLSNTFATPEPGDDGGTISFHDNYFSDTNWLGIYIGGPGTIDGNPVVSYEWVDNHFVNLEPTIDIGYFDEPYYSARVRDTYVFRQDANFVAPVSIHDNEWTGTWNTMDRPASTVTIGTNAMNGSVAPIQFVNTGYPDGTSVLALQMWTDLTATWANTQPVTYGVGDLVMDGLHMYRCVVATTADDPRPSEDTNNKWQDLGVPVDDVRLTASSAHTGIGLFDTL